MTDERADVTLVTELAPDRLEFVTGQKQPTLTVLAGREVGALFVVSTRATVLGRSPDAHVRLEDDGVSRSHARIVHVNGRYMLEDLGSTNGTMVGDQRVVGRMRLDDGARIALGNALLRFAMLDEIELQAAKQTYEASVLDGLTGVFNRRYFGERLTSEFSFAVRQGTALCALMIDIDRFKRINDRFGHQAGDTVLRRIGGLLREATRAEDLLARYGGEEFAVLSRGISLGDARAFAERVRALVERAPIEWESESIPITVSIGLAHNRMGGAAATGAEQLVAAADKALYAAKAAGRNRVEVAASPGRYSVVHSDAPEQDPAAKPKRRTWEQTTFPIGEQNDASRKKPT